MKEADERGIQEALAEARELARKAMEERMSWTAGLDGSGGDGGGRRGRRGRRSNKKKGKKAKKSKSKTASFGGSLVKAMGELSLKEQADGGGEVVLEEEDEEEEGEEEGGDEECAVCLNDLDDGAEEEGMEVEVLRCGHEFHVVCIEMWVRTRYRSGASQVTCPMCRAPLRRAFSEQRGWEER